MRNCDKSWLCNLNLKILTLSDETIWEGREFLGFITREEKKNLCVFVLTSGSESLRWWPREEGLWEKLKKSSNALAILL